MMAWQKCTFIVLLMLGAMLSSFEQTALASNSAAFKVNVQVIDSISVSVDGRASGSNEIIQIEDRASGVTTCIVLD